LSNKQSENYTFATKKNVRTIAEVPHHTFKISIFSYNAKYIVKIELSQFEQSYKLNESDVQGVDDVKKMLTDEFLENCMGRFLTMRTDWLKGFSNLNNE
jgi:hypothetical protein